MKPKIGDTVSFKMHGKIVTGKVSYIGRFCGIDVEIEHDVQTISIEDIVPNPTPKEGS